MLPTANFQEGIEGSSAPLTTRIYCILMWILTWLLLRKSLCHHGQVIDKRLQSSVLSSVDQTPDEYNDLVILNVS